KRVLFVCIGNCCRSQMAEGFANTYGRDVLAAGSAGLAPTVSIDADTLRTMREKNIDISLQFPKRFDPLEALDCDLIVNMSGYDLPEPVEAPVREWKIRDPYRLRPEIYKQVCEDIENQVMQLILELRRSARGL
ncbi:MAG: low molecular weight phosphatase family protein, partial [Bryobacteraceae bacterium]